MAVTIARNASERSLIISLMDSFICLPPFYDLIIARMYVQVKRNIYRILRNFRYPSVVSVKQKLAHLSNDGCFLLVEYGV
jgi:hypothetical protein